jgi:hypothetical protein
LALLTDQDEENPTLLNDKIDALSRETTHIRGDAYNAISARRKSVAVGTVVPPTYKMHFNA